MTAVQVVEEVGAHGRQQGLQARGGLAHSRRLCR